MKILRYLLCHYLFICVLNIYGAQIDSSSSLTKLYFKYFHVPIKQSILSIKSYNNHIYSLGHNFFEFDGTKWIAPKLTSNISDLSSFFVKSNDEIYLVKRDYPLNYSKLFVKSKNSIKQVLHPFGNEIVSIYVNTNNDLWIGGDRELAKRINGVWTFLTFPPTQSSIQQIICSSLNEVWVRTNDEKLFVLDDKVWKQVLPYENILHFCLLSEGSLIVLSNSKVFLVSKGKQTLLYNGPILGEIEQVAAINPKLIYGIGKEGRFIQFDGSNWSRINLIFKGDLKSITLLNNKEGFIACDDGVIIKFSTDPTNSSNYTKYGFQGFKPINIARNLDDEYGVGISDIDNDGDQDIYTVSMYSPNRLYLNDFKNYSSSLTPFLERSVERLTTGINNEDILKKIIPKIQLGTNLGDIDNDGDQDIYITSLVGDNKILLNDGNGYFRDVSFQKDRAQGSDDRSNSAILGDVNNDGWLDVFLVNENSTNRLYLNKGNAFFKDVTTECGLRSIGGSNGATFADVNNDGLLDLFVCNWGRANDFYKNVSSNGKIKFIKMNFSPNSRYDHKEKSNSAVFFDYNNDGLPDLFVARRGYPNRLFLNHGKFVFEDVSDHMFEDSTYLSYSATATDFDNDGFLDLFVSNVGQSVLYKNVNGQKFKDVTLEYGAVINGYCTGSASGDIDSDGDQDLYSACFVDGTSKIFINKTDNNNYILLDIKGTLSNRDAIGAKVFLYDQLTNILCGYREISGGSGYSSINSKQVHFGADYKKLYKIVVVFPKSGKKIQLNSIHPGVKLTLSEEMGLAAIKTKLTKHLSRLIIDPEIQIEILKLIFVLFILIPSFYIGSKRFEWRKSINGFIHSALLIIYIISTWLFLYKELFLSSIFPIGTVILGTILIHLYYERIILARKVKAEKQVTRDRIARDLHDDIASTISSSLIYADALNRIISDDQSKQKTLSHNITSLLSEASESITDLVWSVSPSHDSLQDLIARLRYFISNICQNNNVVSNISIDLKPNELTLDEDVRKNIFLIFKEALQNSIKHSLANEISFFVIQDEEKITWTLLDNGKGFDITSSLGKINPSHGNGLSNMKKRASEIDADLYIKSEIEKGTEIKLITKMS